MKDKDTLIYLLSPIPGQPPMKHSNAFVHAAVVVAAFAAFAGMLIAADPPASKPGGPPPKAASIDRIIESVESLKGFGTPQTAEFRRRRHRAFAVWYCPFSGRAACQLYVYTRPTDGQEWVLVASRMIEGTHDLSVEFPCRGQLLIFRDFEGNAVHQERVESSMNEPGSKAP